MIPSAGVRKAVPHAPESKNATVCPSNPGKEDVCIGRALWGPSQRGTEKAGREGVFVKVVFICRLSVNGEKVRKREKGRKGKGKSGSFRRHSEHHTKLLL